MNWRDCPRITFIPAFRFAEDTIFAQQYFISGLIVPVDSGIVFPCSVLVCLILSVFPYFLPVSKKGNIKQHVPSKNSCTWWGFSTVWSVEWTTHAAFVRKSAMSLSLTVSAMSSSAVRSIVMIVWCTHSSIAFACGFWHWLAYALDHMNHRESQCEIWTHFLCCR